MKKIFNSILIFIFLIVMCGAFFVKNDNSVIAAEEQEDEGSVGSCNPSTGAPNFIKQTLSDNDFSGKCTTTITKNGEEIAKISVTSLGQIYFSYKYGLSEFIIYVTGRRPNNDNAAKAEVLDSTNSKILTPIIVHVSGGKVPYEEVYEKTEEGKYEIRDTWTWGYRSVHLFNYLEYDDRVTLHFTYEFAGKDDYVSGAKGNINFFYPQYCSVDNNTAGCVKENDNLKNQRKTILYRMDNFKANATIIEEGKSMGISDSAIEYMADRFNLVYKGSVDKNWVMSGSDYVYPMANNNIAMEGIKLIVSNSTFDAQQKNFDKIIYDTIIPVALGVLGVIAAITCVVLGTQIIKSSDETQERADKISKLKTIIISLIFVAILLLVIEPVVKFVEGYLEK